MQNQAPTSDSCSYSVKTKPGETGNPSEKVFASEAAGKKMSKTKGSLSSSYKAWISIKTLGLESKWTYRGWFVTTLNSWAHTTVKHICKGSAARYLGKLLTWSESKLLVTADLNDRLALGLWKALSLVLSTQVLTINFDHKYPTESTTNCFPWTSA